MTIPRIVFVALASALPLFPETGHEAWLRYPAIDDPILRNTYASLPAAIVAVGDSPVVNSAQSELIRGIRGMLGRTLRIENEMPAESAIVLGTISGLNSAVPSLTLKADLKPDAFWLTTRTINQRRYWIITGVNDRGVLYGAFALLRKLALHQSIAPFEERQEPYAPVRWVNHWDNLDGTIERGYGGRSIFFDDDNVREDLIRSPRLCASAGLARHQRLLHQQRQCQHARHHSGIPPASGSHRESVPPLGRPHCAFARFQQPAETRQSRYLRSARPACHRVVEEQSRRNL